MKQGKNHDVKIIKRITKFGHPKEKLVTKFGGKFGNQKRS
jgi:hypothetical protein